MAEIKSIHFYPDKPTTMRTEGLFRAIGEKTYDVEIPKQLSEALFGVAQAGLDKKEADIKAELTASTLSKDGKSCD